MASFPESVSMALFCDFENVALGVRDAKYDKFDIMPVLERLLLKGSIVVKKAYCDWDRYKGFKAAMHEASFELIEIPHVRQSGKNSADIRLVVDALDLCYTKSHVDTFVIISGDSDFSPLVSKLRENAKKVIGVGVKNSTSDLLVANCDEFIFYDDLVREQQRAIAKREAREAREARDARDAHAAAASASSSNKRSADDDRQPKQEIEARKAKAIAIAVETFDDLASERGESGKIWASVLKSAIKRRKPDFNESYYGFRAFGNLLEEAQSRGLLEVGRDEKSGAFVFRTQTSAAVETVREVEAPAVATENRQAAKSGSERNRRRGRNTRAQVSEPLFVEAQSEAADIQTGSQIGFGSEWNRESEPQQYPGSPFDEASDAEPRQKSGRERNRRNGRNARPQQAREPLFADAPDAQPETSQASHEQPFFERAPVTVEEPAIAPIPAIRQREEEALALLSEMNEEPQPKRGAARRGRQVAAKKVAAKTSQAELADVATIAETVNSDSDAQPDKVPAAAKKAASKKTPRKTAPRSRRSKPAAASEE
ncbi:NYN domain-containing protein [Caballeronia sp. DA-9]|uniref:NYN domain-containing protein n=1 Tax=Caballeronia sp. DA-9 TaxID=3436237 RepID=UPI003F66F6D9